MLATGAGEIAYIEAGDGPVALFVHGVFFNGELWSAQLDGLADVRRCIAPDLLAHGRSACPVSPLAFEDQVHALTAFLDAAGIDRVDLVGNDTGGAIAQLLAATAPRRVRSLVLTNCDTEGHLPPPAFQPIVELARAGQLAAGVQSIAGDAAAARTSVAMGFEHPESLSDEYLLAMFSPFADPDRARALESYVASFDDRALVEAHDALAAFRAPTLVVWGTADEFFDIEVGRWLTATIAGARDLVQLDGAKLFLPVERPTELNAALRSFWSSLE